MNEQSITQYRPALLLFGLFLFSFLGSIGVLSSLDSNNTPIGRSIKGNLSSKEISARDDSLKQSSNTNGQPGTTENDASSQTGSKDKPTTQAQEAPNTQSPDETVYSNSAPSSAQQPAYDADNNQSQPAANPSNEDNSLITILGL